jgi:glycosyltransferase involved in cell wall biosynthesis
MMLVAQDLGVDPIFCGAMRDEGLEREDSWDGWKVVRLGKPFPLLNGTRPLLYVKSVLSYNVQLFRYLRKTRPELLHSSDFETMPASVLYKLVSRCRLIHNIHDNLAQRYDVSTVTASVLNFFEGLNVLFSDVTLVPEDFRRAALPRWCQRKVSVIRNTPQDCHYSSPDEIVGENKVRIFFGGWLDWGRGLGSLLQLAQENDDVEVRVAGEGAPEVIREIESIKNVQYLGFMTHDAVLKETQRCHFVSALYDPIRKINRFAASNKLAESLATGRPVILNEEMLIAETIGDSSCLITEKYANITKLAPRLRALVSDRDSYAEASLEARRIYDEMFAWEPIREKIRSILAEQLAR